jgi:hypothetical protein
MQRVFFKTSNYFLNRCVQKLSIEYYSKKPFNSFYLLKRLKTLFNVSYPELSVVLCTLNGNVRFPEVKGSEFGLKDNGIFLHRVDAKKSFMCNFFVGLKNITPSNGQNFHISKFFLFPSTLAIHPIHNKYQK